MLAKIFWLIIVIIIILSIGITTFFVPTYVPKSEKSNIQEEIVCSVVKFDGCEYIENKYYDGAGNLRTILTHKGNCSNPIHYKVEK